MSAKTVHNFWITLSAFFTWASAEFGLPNPIKAIPAPSFEEAPVEPYTQEEVERLLKACDYTAEARPHDRHKFTMRRAMVQHYAKLAEVDIQQAHRRASPADNWRL